MKSYIWAACALAVVGAARGATIVHDAARDLVINSRSANIFTNAYGGVWSFMGASSYASSSPRQLLTSTRAYVNNVTSMTHDINGYEVVMLRGPSIPKPSSGYQLPVIAVNQSVMTATNSLTNAGFPTIPPGQLALHPGHDLCAVLRFTVPRTGVYTVTAQAWNQNSGLLGMTLQTNGVLTRARMAWRGSEHRGQTNDLSLAATTFRAGDTIEMTFDDGGNLNSNAAGVNFRIAEEVLDVIDANAACCANVLSAVPTNAWTTTAGTWQAFRGGAWASATNSNRLTLTPGYVRTAQGSNARGFAVNGALPWLVVNASANYVTETNAAGKATFCQGRALAPGEIMMHPGTVNTGTAAAVTNAPMTVGLRFSPDTNGYYDIGFTVRDMAKQSSADNTSGVNVWLLQGLQVLGKTYASLENGVSCATFFVRDVPLVSEIPVEIVVDANGEINSDGTALTWACVKTRDIPSAYDASVALKACFAAATPVNPFTYNGCTWAVGRLQGGYAGAFTAFPNVQTVSRFEGAGRTWGETLDTSPYLGVNTAGRKASGTASNTYAAGRGMLYAHPKSDNSASCIRFTAAKRGIYKATMWVKGLNAGGGDGTDVHILTNGVNAASRIVSAAKANPYGDLKVEPFYLRPGGTITFAVGANGAYDFDLTGFHAWVEKIEPDGLPTGVTILIR